MKLSNLTTVVLAHQLTPSLLTLLSQLNTKSKVLLAWNKPVPAPKQLAQYASLTVLHLPDPIIDFSAARNIALSKVTTEWCLMLDSDEFIDQEGWQYIEQEITSPTADGYFLQRFDVFLGRELRWGEVKDQWLLRLFRTSLTHFERPIHEVAVVAGNTTKSAASITHAPHPTITEFLTDVSSYAVQEAKMRHAAQKSWSLFETITFPIGKFLYNVIINQAWRDGFPGLIYCYAMSAHSFWVRVYLYELIHQKKSGR